MCIRDSIKNARENEAEHIVLSSGITSTDHPYLRVADDGTGIEPDVLERIFIPFFTTKPSGSGIGLTISRQIMHQHNEMCIRDRHQGDGDDELYAYQAFQHPSLLTGFLAPLECYQRIDG